MSSMQGKLNSQTTLLIITRTDSFLKVVNDCILASHDEIIVIHSG